MGDRDIARLMEWEAFGGDPVSGCVRLSSHPRFAVAARSLAANMLAVAASDHGLDGIFKDAGRYVATMWALYLHVLGGLTLPKFKQACRASGFLSLGRARSMLIYLRHLGYIEPVARSAAGAVHYAPTSRLEAAWSSHLRAALRAAVLIEPAAALVADALDRPGVAGTLNRIRSRGLLSSAGAADQDVAFVRIFMHRHAGTQIAWMLIAAGEDRTAFPSRESVHFPVAMIARRFGVSRVHVRRLFQDALDEDLLECDGDGGLRFTDAACAHIQFLYAAHLVQLLASTAATLRERPDLAG